MHPPLFLKQIFDLRNKNNCFSWGLYKPIIFVNKIISAWGWSMDNYTQIWMEQNAYYSFSFCVWCFSLSSIYFDVIIDGDRFCLHDLLWVEIIHFLYAVHISCFRYNIGWSSIQFKLWDLSLIFCWMFKYKFLQGDLPHSSYL